MSKFNRNSLLSIEDGLQLLPECGQGRCSSHWRWQTVASLRRCHQNARSPSVERFVGVTASVSVTGERRRRRPSISAHRRRLSARYDGAVPWRQR